MLGAVRAGLPGLILREPTLSAQHARRMIAALQDALGERLIVHLKTAGALESGQPLHLPGSVDPAAYVGRVPVGLSAHSIEALRMAHAAGCAYATYSPVFSPTSKPTDRRPTLGVAGLAAGVAAVPMPVVALGGINAQRARDCFSAGAAAVAGISAFFDETSIREMMQESGECQVLVGR